MVDSSVAHWSLRIGEPYPDSYVALVVPAETSSGERAVLKIQFPDRESRAEALALRAWAGNGAVRLLDELPDLDALLIERCEPGYHLSAVGPGQALDVLVELLPRLWIPAGDRFVTLTEESRHWGTNLPVEWEAAGRPFAESLVEEVVRTMAELAESQGEHVLLHQDLHGHNVLAAQRKRWLAIDPKPLVGEREFGLSPIVRSAELGHSKEHVIHRLDRLSDELGLDRDRARLWAACHAVAWGFENGRVLPGHIEMARWLLAA